MNHKIKTLTSLSVLAFAIIAITGGVTAQARLADVTTTINAIPADSTTPTIVYIPYGSANSDLDIRNAIATANLTGSGFVFDTTG